jgi:hypothetical protein
LCGALVADCSSRRIFLIQQRGVRLNLVEYEEIRTDSRQFLNALGHDRVEGPVEVMFKNHNYLVVKKSGLSGAIAAGLDTRRDGRRAD